MAFLLRDLPGAQHYDRFAQRYPDLDPKATEAFLRVLRLGSDYLDLLDDILEPFGLRHGRWITLILLLRRESRSATPSELAEAQGVRRATMTGLLNALENDGLIQRIPDERDARSSAAKLTRRGVRLLDRVMPVYYERVAELMSAMPKRDLDRFVRLLRAAPPARD